MERGVIVGGLMICGSFLLAALLNRSAMEEMPAPATTAPAVVAPVIAPTSDSKAAACSDAAEADPNAVIEPVEPAGSDLMVNGTERCPR